MSERSQLPHFMRVRQDALVGPILRSRPDSRLPCSIQNVICSIRTPFPTYLVVAQPVVALQVINAHLIKQYIQSCPASQWNDAEIVSVLSFDPVAC